MVDTFTFIKTLRETKWVSTIQRKKYIKGRVVT